MTTLPIKIVVGPNGRASTIIDGHDVSGNISGVEVRSDVNHGTVVRLDFVNVEVDIEGAVDASTMQGEWVTYLLGKAVRDGLQQAVEGDHHG